MIPSNAAQNASFAAGRLVSRAGSPKNDSPLKSISLMGIAAKRSFEPGCLQRSDQCRSVR